MKRILLALSILVISVAAWALDLKSAKSQGLVGEANTGYLALVNNSNSAASALVSEVNAKRRQKFAATAQTNGVAVDQVAYRFYQRAVEQTASGNYYQDASGRWVKKP